MSIKKFKPQLNSSIFLNQGKFTNFYNIFWSIIIGVCSGVIICCGQKEFIGAANIQITPLAVLVGIGVMIFSYYFISSVQRRIKMWDMGAPYTIKIDTEYKKISLDDSIKFYIDEIVCIDIVEYEPPSSLVCFHTYYSIVNAVMKFYLKDGQVIDFYVQNANQLIQIIKLLRKLGANVKETMTEYANKDAENTQWIFLVFLIIMGIFAYLSNKCH